MHPAFEGIGALPYFDEFDLSTVDVLLISQYVIISLFYLRPFLPERKPRYAACPNYFWGLEYIWRLVLSDENLGFTPRVERRDASAAQDERSQSFCSSGVLSISCTAENQYHHNHPWYCPRTTFIVILEPIRVIVVALS